MKNQILAAMREFFSPLTNPIVWIYAIVSACIVLVATQDFGL